MKLFVTISSVICECGHIMSQDGDGAFTCFNHACTEKGRTLAPVIQWVEIGEVQHG